jgi:hypothetical protein
MDLPLARIDLRHCLIKWNFTKFIIDRQGNVVNRFLPMEDPLDISANIEMKFHFIGDPKIPGCSFFKCVNNGCSSFPFTDILANTGNVTPSSVEFSE